MAHKINHHTVQRRICTLKFPQEPSRQSNWVKLVSDDRERWGLGTAGGCLLHLKTIKFENFKTTVWEKQRSSAGQIKPRNHLGHKHTNGVHRGYCPMAAGWNTTPWKFQANIISDTELSSSQAEIRNGSDNQQSFINMVLFNQRFDQCWRAYLRLNSWLASVLPVKYGEMWFKTEQGCGVELPSSGRRTWQSLKALSTRGQS